MENSSRDGNTRPPDLPLEKPIGKTNSYVKFKNKIKLKVVKFIGKKKKERNLYAGQEATVRTGHGTTDWFQIGKGVRQGCI